MSLAAMEQMLNTMAINGVIGRTEKEGTRHFYTLPLVVGMYEGQVKRLDREFLDDFESYATSRAFGLAMLGPGVPQMRTIPVEKSLSYEHQVTTHDHLEHVITTAKGPSPSSSASAGRRPGYTATPARRPPAWRPAWPSATWR